MAYAPDAFLISSSTALGMTENLAFLLDTMIRNLPEPELRRAHRVLADTIRVADDTLFKITISSTFGVHSFSDEYTIHGADVSATGIASLPRPPAEDGYALIVSSRPHVGCPSYELHPAFVDHGIPGPYVSPPVDPSGVDPATYFVIIKGVYVGIFTRWKECSSWVIDIPGSVFYKVRQWTEAMNLYNAQVASDYCEVLP